MNYTIDNIIEYINSANEEAAAKAGYYAADAAFDLADEFGLGHAAESIEAHLEHLIEGGARFDEKEAGEVAARDFVRRALQDAEQELGEDATVAKAVAHVLGDDGSVFELAPAGDWAPAIDLDLVAEVAAEEYGGHKEDRRWVFADGSEVFWTDQWWDIK